MEKPQISVRLSEDARKQLHWLAKRLGLTRSAVIEMSIRRQYRGERE